MLENNYLERIPCRSPHIPWDADEEGRVTLHVANKGIVKKLTQVFFGKPAISHVHLDEMGSFIWMRIDGEMSVSQIGEMIEERYGDAASHVYGRLAEFFRILDSYGFLCWNR